MDRWLLAFALAGLVGVGGFWLLFFVVRSKPVAPAADGSLTLRHSGLFRLYGFGLFIGLLATLGGLSLSFPPDSRSQVVLTSILAVGSALLGIVMIWEATQFSCRIDGTGLHGVSPWRGKRDIPWTAIKQVSFSEVNMWFAVEPETGPPFHIMAIVPGANQFLASCEANLPHRKLLPAEVGYAWVWRPFPPVKDRDRVRQPRLMKWLRRIALTGVAIVLLAAGLFVANGTVLAAGTTPVMREIKIESIAPRDRIGERQVVVMTYNIAKAFAHIDGVKFEEPARVMARLNKIAEAIQKLNPDVVCLQEVMTEAGTMPVDQVEYLARACRLPYTAFGENYNFGVPGYRVVGGNAILSRTPLTSVANIDLVGRKPFYRTHNSRRALFASTELHGQTLLIGSVHNDSYDPANNDRQAEQLLAFIGDRPCLLAGDFNANPNSPTMNRLHESGKFSGRFFDKAELPAGIEPAAKVKDDPTIPKTFPSHAPDQHLDYILGPKAWEHQELTVMMWPASDHLPVFSVFQVPGETK
jgi:endonuclease/exonuclease/phosphatase family metal-dependent hydrolase